MDDRKEGVLARWSRLKSRGDEPASGAAERLPQAAAAAAAPMPRDDDSGDDFDPATLPPLETLGRDSDYSGFLHRKVPDALRRAALRKAWASDPAITGYKPLVEYDWDWNAEGYGALRPTDDAAKVVARMFRHLQPPETGEAVEGQEEEADAGAGTVADRRADEPGETEA